MNENLNRQSIVLFAAGADNWSANSNNIIFTIKYIKLYVPADILTVKENHIIKSF